MQFRIRGARGSSHIGHDPYETTPVADGFQLASGSTATQAFTFGCFTAVWLAISSVFVIIGVGTGELPAIIFGMLFVGIGLALLVPLVRTARIAGAWGNATVVIDHWPLLMGESASCWFSQSDRNGTAPAESVTATLTLRESATYRSGTDTRTATEDVVSLPLSVAAHDRDGTPGFTMSFQIPQDGPPTIQLPRNRVEWLLLITATRTGVPDAESVFGVRVEAAMAT